MSFKMRKFLRDFDTTAHLLWWADIVHWDPTIEDLIALNEEVAAEEAKEGGPSFAAKNARKYLDYYALKYGMGTENADSDLIEYQNLRKVVYTDARFSKRPWTKEEVDLGRPNLEAGKPQGTQTPADPAAAAAAQAAAAAAAAGGDPAAAAAAAAAAVTAGGDPAAAGANGITVKVPADITEMVNLSKTILEAQTALQTRKGPDPNDPSKQTAISPEELTIIAAEIAAAKVAMATAAAKFGIGTGSPSAEVAAWEAENFATLKIQGGVLVADRTADQALKWAEKEKQLALQRQENAKKAAEIDAINKETDAINYRISNPSAGPTPPLTETAGRAFDGVTGAIGRFAEYTGMPRGLVDFFSNATKGVANFAMGTASDWKAEKNPMLGVFGGIIGLFVGSWGSSLLANIPVLGGLLGSGPGKFAVTAAVGMMAFKWMNDWAGVGTQQTEPGMSARDRLAVLPIGTSPLTSYTPAPAPGG